LHLALKEMASETFRFLMGAWRNRKLQAGLVAGVVAQELRQGQRFFFFDLGFL
jgi:hypothetical protein